MVAYSENVTKIVRAATQKVSVCDNIQSKQYYRWGSNYRQKGAELAECEGFHQQ
jgi:hypothetical protein